MNTIKSKPRVADHWEVFTPPWLVEAMLDLVKSETERIDAHFLEPACGSGTHHETFALRREQAEAVHKTHAYFHSIWQEDMQAVPRFLWNAKMRFGKTFATYRLAKRLGAKRVLVVTFKPAVEDAWQTDGLSRFLYDQMQDYVRGVTRQVTIGRTTRQGKPLNNWFVLCRSE